MKPAHLIAAAGLAALLCSGTAFAQATTPATTAPAAPAATSAGMPAAGGMASMDKKAKSKECSDRATQQGLHGKERKAFRSKCKAGKI